MLNDQMTKYDTVVIGSGPAGLTAAIYLARGGLKTLVLTGDQPGGQLTTTTEVGNFPGFPKGILGGELMARMRQQAERFGAEFVLTRANKVVNKMSNKMTNKITNKIANKIEKTGNHKKLIDHDRSKMANRKIMGFLIKTNSEEEITTRAVIIATGASPRWLEVSGEERLRGRGVSACATCDGPFFKNKTVVVIGGGNAALTEAEFLTRFAQKVFLIHRREHYRAEEILQERIKKNEKVVPLFNTQVKEFLGDEKLTGLLLESRLRVETGEYAHEIAQYPNKFGARLLKDGRSATIQQKLEDSFQWQLAVDGAFVAIGHQPNTDFLKGFLELDEKGYIKTKDEVFTSVEGVFAAGDCADHRYQQAVTAAAMGCKAALETVSWLSSNG